MSVYFAKVGRYIKVGFSENPERRVANLWRSTTRYSRPWDCPLDKPELLLVIRGHLGTEQACHKALAQFHAGTEWFIDEPEVRAFMERAAHGDLSPVVRPGGQFEVVAAEQMSSGRQAELDKLIERASAKKNAA